MRKTYEDKEPEKTRDENTSVAAKYYVNQILSLDEGALQEAWSKVGSAQQAAALGLLVTHKVMHRKCTPVAGAIAIVLRI